jgi:hypothetical protein
MICYHPKMFSLHQPHDKYVGCNGEKSNENEKH